MRYFQKANQRTELPAVCLEGFHPHQTMDFAVPLGMGLEGKAEYFDLHITEEDIATLHSAEAIECLNREMAEGTQILSFLRLPNDSLNYVSTVHAADYEILFRAIALEDKITGQFVGGSAYQSLAGDEERSPHAAVDELLQYKEIPVQKTGKRGSLRELDLRPMTHVLRCEDNHLRCTTTQNSEANLKSEPLLSALFSPDTARPLTAMPRRVVRTELYDSAGKTLESYGTTL